MRYETKSILIGRKKSTNEDDTVRPCFISLFTKNNSHLSEEGPTQMLEFEQIHKVIIKNLEINYLLPGNDLVINELEYVEVEQEGSHITVTGKHKI